MARLFARWIGRRRTFDALSTVDRPVAGLAHSPTSGIVKAYFVEPSSFSVRSELTTSPVAYFGAASGELAVINQVLVMNPTGGAVNAYVGIMATSSGTPDSSNAWLLWGSSVAAYSFFRWDGICPMEDRWLYAYAAGADALVLSVLGQYADYYE